MVPKQKQAITSRQLGSKVPRTSAGLLVIPFIGPDFGFTGINSLCVCTTPRPDNFFDCRDNQSRSLARLFPAALDLLNVGFDLENVVVLQSKFAQGDCQFEQIITIAATRTC